MGQALKDFTTDVTRNVHHYGDSIYQSIWRELRQEGRNRRARLKHRWHEFQAEWDPRLLRQRIVQLHDSRAEIRGYLREAHRDAERNQLAANVLRSLESDLGNLLYRINTEFPTRVPDES